MTRESERHDRKYGDRAHRELPTVFDELEVCTHCGDVRGPFTWIDSHGRRRLEQECACQRELRTEPVDAWSGFDFNAAATLCGVCSAEMLMSGSQFSALVCDACCRRAREVNQRLGRVVVATGRHSLTRRDADDIAERVQRLDAWSKEALGRNLDAVGLTRRRPVPLAEYLDAVRGIDRGQRFEECLGFLGLVGAG